MQKYVQWIVWILLFAPLALGCGRKSTKEVAVLDLSKVDAKTGEALQKIQALGGKVNIDATQVPPVITVDFRNSGVKNADLAILPDVTNLQVLVLESTNISDAAVANLKGLKQLLRLNLSETFVTDEGLKDIAGLAQLEELKLQKTRITNAGLEQLKGLTKLTKLNLSENNKLGDAGMKNLVEMKELQHLNIWNTQVSNASVAYFAQLKSLKEISIYKTNISDQGVKELKAAIPSVNVILNLQSKRREGRDVK